MNHHHAPWFLILWMVCFSGGLIAVTIYAYLAMRKEKDSKKLVDEQLPQLAAMAQRRFEKAHGRKSVTLTTTFPELEKVPPIKLQTKG